MEEYERNLRRAAAKRKKLLSLGIKTDVCILSGDTDVANFELDHVAGRKHDDIVWPLSRNSHRERNSMQREQPPSSPDPRNPFEVIGRWLLGMAEYFEMLIRVLRRFGEYLIDLAKQGYGTELHLPV
jgi:hypothetical protein